jgi:ribosomal protein L37E
MQVFTMQIVTWSVSIKSILEINRISFLENHGNLVRDITKHEVEKVLECRTEAKGFVSYVCNHCGKSKHIAFSCKSRFCNSCGTPASDKRMHNLLQWFPKSLTYRHLIFTIPLELREFFHRHRACLRILEQTASQVILYNFQKKHKLLPGIMSVIHTFGAQLNWNPHVHMVCTYGWFDQHDMYKKISYLPFPALYYAWKVYLIKNLKIWCKDHILDSSCSNELKFLNDLYNQVDDLWMKKCWFIHFWDPSGFAKIIVSYIGRYLKRPTIAQSRITWYDWEYVTYTYVDKYDGDQKENKITAYEFIKLLVQHIPNRYFHMAMYRGAFANRCKKKYLAKLRAFNEPRSNPIIPTTYAHRYFRSTGKDPFLCECGSHMVLYAIIIPGYPPKYFDTS